jgi:hypothetical protein
MLKLKLLFETGSNVKAHNWIALTRYLMIQMEILSLKTKMVQNFKIVWHLVMTRSMIQGKRLV